jgi:hypothetical protein
MDDNNSVKRFLFVYDPVFLLAVTTALISCVVVFIADSSPRIILGAGFTLSALLYIYYRYRISNRDSFFFVSWGLAVLTVGVGLTLVNPEPLIFGIGFSLTVLSFIYYRYRVSSGNPTVYSILAVIISSLGFVFAIQLSDYVLFAVGFALLSLFLVFNMLLRSLHRSNSLN